MTFGVVYRNEKVQCPLTKVFSLNVEYFFNDVASLSTTTYTPYSKIKFDKTFLLCKFYTTKSLLQAH